MGDEHEQLINLPGHPEGEFLLGWSWGLDKPRTHLAAAGKGLLWSFMEPQFPLQLWGLNSQFYSSLQQKPAQFFPFVCIPAHKNQGKARFQPITTPVSISHSLICFELHFPSELFLSHSALPKQSWDFRIPFTLEGKFQDSSQK